MALNSINIYYSYLAAMEPLSDAERGRLLTACLRYSVLGEVTELRGNERFLFPSWKEQIDRDKEKYAAKCKTLSRSAKKRWESEECKCMQMDANASSNMQMHANASKDKDKEKDKEKDKDKDKKEKNISIEILKKKFGEFENVVLTGEEHEKLVDSLGDMGAREYIERLSSYLAQSGRQYKSHYATMLNWWRKDGKPVSRSKGDVVIKPDKEREITPDMTAEELF